MLDLGYVREHLDAIEQMAHDRGITLDLAPFHTIDTERRQLITATERLKAGRNKASDEIARLKKAGQDASTILARMKDVRRDQARRRANQRTRRAIASVSFDGAQYSAPKRSPGEERDGQRGSAPLGHASEI